MKSKIEMYSGNNEHIRELISKEPAWLIKWGTTVLFIVIAILIVLGGVVKYPDVIVAKIVITTINPPVRLYSKTNGIVKELFVKDNDTVRDGDRLILLKDEHDISYRELLELERIISNLSIIRGRKLRIEDLENYAFKNLGGIQEKVYLCLNEARQYNSLIDDKPFEKEMRKNQQLIKQYNLLITVIERKLASAKAQLELASTAFKRQQLLYEAKVTSKSDYEKESIEFYEVQKSYNDIETTLQMYGLRILELEKEIDKIKIDEGNIEYKSFITLSTSIKDLKADIAAYEDRYVIKSSIDGQISYLKYNVKGQLLKADVPIIAIIPFAEEQLIANLYLPVVGSGKVKIGQQVRIFLDNYPYQEYGIIKGIITSISLVPTNEAYLINVTLPDRLKTQLTNLEFRQELSGEAEIITEDISLLQRFAFKLRGISKR
ncbi:MAG: HlyD family secretion protein [Cyclobacteriaceae bacterium]